MEGRLLGACGFFGSQRRVSVCVADVVLAAASSCRCLSLQRSPFLTVARGTISTNLGERAPPIPAQTQHTEMRSRKHQSQACSARSCPRSFKQIEGSGL